VKEARRNGECFFRDDFNGVCVMVPIGVDESVSKLGTSYHRLVTWLVALAMIAVVAFAQSESVDAQTQPARGAAQSQKIARKEAPPQPEVPAPDVVNAEMPKKLPADPLDGPPFVTARTWAIADGRTGEVLWGHGEAMRVDIASTTKINPNGLPAQGHQSSARDLARLTHHALALPTFAKYVSTPKRGCTLLGPNGHRRNVVWTNTNRLLGTEGYDGVKTGTTRAAGECLVASGRRGDDHLIVVILGASSTDARYADARNLFRYAWHMRGRRPA
jgi:D-alanyl-D-alanine carboxypeptidase